ncbi:MAG: hypothetical protein E7391_02710 [Ruminococcaceae bacterium]|nr:hypothetical protein [Oscillospiraceae bacterium]
MTKKPLIAITPQVTADEPGRIRILDGYYNSISKSGGIGCMLTFTDDIDAIKQIAKTFDAFLFSGGVDIDPSYYDEKATPYLRETSDARDKFETLLLKELISMDKPVLGICRGLQIINVTFGGTLYQDIVSQNVSHQHHYMSEPYNVPYHDAKVLPNTLLYDITGETVIGVNSRHHQAIKKIAPHFLPMAFSEDGIIEAVYNPDKKFFMGVQWHPEDMYDGFKHSREIFKRFIEEAKS